MGLVNDEKEVKVPSTTNDIIDVNIDGVKLQRFRINGDDNKILELNTTDMGIVSRLNEAYKKLDKLANQASDFKDSDIDDNSPEALDKLAKKLSDIDKQMRELVDYIFDANVSEVCCDRGTMYDPKNGMFRYEHIIGALAPLYENNFNKEFNAMKQRMKKHTAKYTKR